MKMTLLKLAGTLEVRIKSIGYWSWPFMRQPIAHLKGFPIKYWNNTLEHQHQGFPPQWQWQCPIPGRPRHLEAAQSSPTAACHWVLTTPSNKQLNDSPNWCWFERRAMEGLPLHRFFPNPLLAPTIPRYLQHRWSSKFFGLVAPKLRRPTSTNLSTSEYFIQWQNISFFQIFIQRFFTAASPVDRPDLECLVRKICFHFRKVCQNNFSPTGGFEKHGDGRVVQSELQRRLEHQHRVGPGKSQRAEQRRILERSG